jgi:hypothetical protein
MHVPSPAELIAMWEQGARQHPVDRALTLLSAAHPEMKHSELAALRVGARDARLLDLRERLFGHALKSFAECPSCQTRLEFAIDVNDLRVNLTDESASAAAEFTSDGVRISFRALDSEDLRAASRCTDVATARRVLLERCIVDARRDEEPVSTASLPQRCVEELSARVEALDSAADTSLELQCVSCSHSWQIALDIVAFLWAEIQCLAKRYLNEVHMLAWAYGWSEADILAMSSVRRQFYLELVE